MVEEDKSKKVEQSNTDELNVEQDGVIDALEAEQNFIGFLDALLKIDFRLHPERYRKADDDGEEKHD